MDDGRSRPVAVVTGANSGVGYEATRRLAEAGWEVVMLCRSAERGGEARDRLVRETGSDGLTLDLADLAVLDEVRAAAERIGGGRERLHALVLNAGVYEERCRRTADGFERTLAVNHLAHVLLALRLLPALEAAGGRVVTVASGAHRRARPRRAPLEAVLRGEAWEGGLTAYGDSKLANVLFAFELDRRLRVRGVRADAVHPGVLATRIWDRTTGLKGLLARFWRLFMDPPSAGGEAVTRPLLDAEAAGGGGRYFDGTEAAQPSADARDPELARELWDASLEALAPWLPDATGPTPPAGPARPGSGPRA